MAERTNVSGWGKVVTEQTKEVEYIPPEQVCPLKDAIASCLAIAVKFARYGMTS
jgi:hypothetical protein